MAPGCTAQTRATREGPGTRSRARSPHASRALQKWISRFVPWKPGAQNDPQSRRSIQNEV